MDEGMSGFCIKTTTTGGGGGGGSGGGGGTKCGRWNPTAEQVKVLTDLFRSGLRTPSTDQIQRISSQLSYYGKIESKNVFYWFQNHKARERQKRRRISTVVVVQDDNRCRGSQMDHRDHHLHHHNNNNYFPPKHYEEIQHHHHHHVSEERERGGEIETLQLFPLNSYDEILSEPNEKMMKVFRNNEYKENMFSCGGMRKENIDDHLPLDLRLSFM